MQDIKHEFCDGRYNGRTVSAEVEQKLVSVDSNASLHKPVERRYSLWLSVRLSLHTTQLSVCGIHQTRACSAEYITSSHMSSTSENLYGFWIASNRNAGSTCKELRLITPSDSRLHRAVWNDFRFWVLRTKHVLAVCVNEDHVSDLKWIISFKIPFVDCAILKWVCATIVSYAFFLPIRPYSLLLDLD